MGCPLVFLPYFRAHCCILVFKFHFESKFLKSESVFLPTPLRPFIVRRFLPVEEMIVFFFLPFIRKSAILLESLMFKYKTCGKFINPLLGVLIGHFCLCREVDLVFMNNMKKQKTFFHSNDR